MKNMKISAPALTASGYGAKSREFIKFFLMQKNFNVFIEALNWGITPWILNKSFFNGEIENIMQKCANPPQNVDVNLEIRLPNEIKNCGYTNILATSLVETTICNPEWLEHINKTQLTIVPSTFNKKVIEDTSSKFNKFVLPPVEVIPESFPDEILTAKPMNLNLETDFNFLLCGQLTGNNPFNDRKNTFFSLKWLCETFKSDKNVGIIIKTNSGRYTENDKYKCETALKRVLNECRKGKYPKVYLLHGLMENEEMAGLYKNPKVKAMVALTRGESFGRPILEASASGLPVIATNWSGHLDFLNKGKWIKVNYELKDVDKSLLSNKNIFTQGAQWAEPIESDAKKKLAKFRERPDLPKEWAKELSQIIRKEYCFESLSKKYYEIFKKHGAI